MEFQRAGWLGVQAKPWSQDLEPPLLCHQGQPPSCQLWPTICSARLPTGVHLAFRLCSLHQPGAWPGSYSFMWGGSACRQHSAGFLHVLLP